MGKNRLILLFLIALFGSCVSRNRPFEQAIHEYSIQLDSSYSIPNLCDHFPEYIENGPNVVLQITWPSDAAKSEIYLSNKCTNSQANDILSKNRIVQKYRFSDSTNFFMTLSWMWDSTIFAKHVCFPNDKAKLPIPQFENIEFGTKTITYSEISDGEVYNVETQLPPEDLEVYVIDAQHGDFWKTNNTQRPALLMEWKNGYSRGFAFSKTSEIFIYWLIAW